MPTIYLCSPSRLTAFRLNLTIANRIHIVEPQWNPSVESQAIGRTLRIGQEKPVTIKRYIVRNSVEEVRSGNRQIDRDIYLY